MNFKSMMLRERTKTQNTTYHMILLMQNSRKGKIIATADQWLLRSVSQGGDWLQRDMRKYSQMLEMLYIMIVYFC